MAVTNYYTVNGEIIGEQTSGQSRLDYLSDALGSVVATVDQTLTMQSTARYKPYGADLAVNAFTQRYGYAGSWGYRRSGGPHTDLYVRQRYPGTAEGRWSSADPLWPSEASYSYCGSSPTTRVDPYGLSIEVQECVCPKCVNHHLMPAPPAIPLRPLVNEMCDDLAKCKASTKGCWPKLISCIQKNCGYDYPKTIATCMNNACQATSGRAVVVHCGGTSDCGFADGSGPCNIYTATKTSVVFCGCDPPDNCVVPQCGWQQQTIAHELSHCCGLRGDTGLFGYNKGVGDCISCCVLHALDTRPYSCFPIK